MKFISICLCFILLLSACGQEQQNTSVPKAVKKAPVTAIDHLTNQYLALKEALVISDAEKAAKQAVALQKMLEASNSANARTLLASVKLIVAAENLETQRRAFLPLSRDLAVILKNSRQGNITLYVQHCPMAFDNAGGDWLSDSEEILNPYYGDEMLHCGYVKETLGAN